jgi:hypothetical protein
VANACSPKPPPAQSAVAPLPHEPVLAIEHVTVLPMTGGRARPNATVIIADGQAGPENLGAGAVRLDGSGKWLMPALTDMHVHVSAEPQGELPYGPEQVLSPFVALGVLQIVDLASNQQTNALRDEIAAGKLRGPRLATARMVDGDPPIWGPEVATVAPTPLAARDAVAAIEREGYDFVKVYSQLERGVFSDLLREAQSRGVRVIGHIPGGPQAKSVDVLVPGFAMVTHAEEFAWHDSDWSDANIAAHVALVRSLGIALTSTLFLNEQLLAQTRAPEMLETVEGLAQVNPAELGRWFESNRTTALASPERIQKLAEGVRLQSPARARVCLGGHTGAGGQRCGHAWPGSRLLAARGATSPGARGLTKLEILEAATSKPAASLGWHAGSHGSRGLGVSQHGSKLSSRCCDSVAVHH